MITSSYPRYRGDFAGVFVKSLADGLARAGHDVHVLVAYDPELTSPWDRSQVKTHHFPYAISRQMHILGYARSLRSDARMKPLALALIPVYLTSAFAAVVKLHLTEKFDVLHAHWVIPCGPVAALASALLRIPLVVSLHGSDVFVAENNRLYANVAKACFGRAQAVVACSDDLRDRAISVGAPKDKASTIPYGVDARIFSTVSPTQEMSSILSKHSPLVLAAGRLVGKKGFEYFLKAIPLILQEIPFARFMIVGDGDDRVRLTNLARELGIEKKVVFAGAVPWDQMPLYLSACDVFVVPSIRDPSGNVDGLPNTLLEAMAAGKAIVATKVAGIPQVIDHGVDGLLVAEKSHREIAHAVGAILQSRHLAERLGKSAQDKVRLHFSWERAAYAYERVYESVRKT